MGQSQSLSYATAILPTPIQTLFSEPVDATIPGALAMSLWEPPAAPMAASSAHNGPDGPTRTALEITIAGLQGQAQSIYNQTSALNPNAPGYQASLAGLYADLANAIASIASTQATLAGLDCDGSGPSGSSGPTSGTGPTSFGIEGIHFSSCSGPSGGSSASGGSGPSGSGQLSFREGTLFSGWVQLEGPFGDPAKIPPTLTIEIDYDFNGLIEGDERIVVPGSPSMGQTHYFGKVLLDDGISPGNGSKKDPSTPENNLGLMRWAIERYRSGWDVHAYNEEDAGSPLTSIEVPFQEILSAVNKRGVTQVSLIGYSHGGGEIYELTAMMVARAAWFTNYYTVPFTACVDAVEFGQADPTPENRRPLLTSFHLNQYQTHLVPSSFLLHGGPSGAEIEVDQTSNGLYHTTIDDDDSVLQLMTLWLEHKLAK